MKSIKISYNKVPGLSKKDLAYINRDPQLETFTYSWPSLENIETKIEDRKQFPIDRSVLVQALSEQYKTQVLSDKTQKHIEALSSENCFCITTAHQPCLLTGPLYYIYKIGSAINLTRQLSERYPSYQFVPVFISGGEDHDFDEINHLRIFGKEIRWNRETSGPVGRMDIEGLQTICDTVSGILGDRMYGIEIKDMLESSLKRSQKYSDFVFNIVNHLFGEYGLVILNMDNKKLKEKFIPHIKEEIFNTSSQAIVTETIGALEKVGFKAQANPREINFFYLEDKLRKRIVANASGFILDDESAKFSVEEMNELIQQSPEKFSPNVVMRPLYQEMILPNLAYVGGGGEIAYWLERKTQFKKFNVSFPILIRRNSALYIDKSAQKQMDKFGFDHIDIMKEDHELIKQYIESNADNTLDISEQRNQVSHVFDELAIKAKNIEQPLEKVVLAEKAKQLKVLDYLESRILKAEKQKHEIEINRIKKLKDKLFPNQKLQERYDNFLSIYLKFGKAYLDYLVHAMDPLDDHFMCIMEGET